MTWQRFATCLCPANERQVTWQETWRDSGNLIQLKGLPLIFPIFSSFSETVTEREMRILARSLSLLVISGDFTGYIISTDFYSSLNHLPHRERCYLLVNLLPMNVMRDNPSLYRANVANGTSFCLRQNIDTLRTSQTLSETLGGGGRGTFRGMSISLDLWRE